MPKHFFYGSCTPCVHEEGLTSAQFPSNRIGCCFILIAQGCEVLGFRPPSLQEGAQMLSKESGAIDFVRDAFAHLKAIGVDCGGQALLRDLVTKMTPALAISPTR